MKPKLKKILSEVAYSLVMTSLVIGIIFCFYKAFEGYSIDHDYYPYADHIAFGLVPISYDDEIFAQDEGDKPTSHYYKKVLENYNLIPEVIREDYKAKGGKICIKKNVDAEISCIKNRADESVYYRAFYMIKTKEIVLRYVPFYDSVIHEMGHFFSMTYELNCGHDLVEAQREEGERMLYRFGHNNTDASLDEFYAVAFCKYFTEPEALKECCPKAYAIIESDVMNAEEIIKEGNSNIEN